MLDYKVNSIKTLQREWMHEATQKTLSNCHNALDDFRPAPVHSGPQLPCLNGEEIGLNALP